MDRRFSRDVLWNVASLGVLGVSGIVINIVITGLRGGEALGVFNQVFAFYIVLSQIAVGGLQFSALKHISYSHEDRRQCSIIATSALILVAALGGLVSLLVFSAREMAGDVLKSEAVSEGIGFMAPGLLFYSLNKVLINILNGMRNMRAYAVFQSVRFALIVAGIVTLILMGYPNSWLPLALTLAEVVLFLCLLTYVHILLFPLTLRGFNLEWFHRHLAFGFRGVFGGIMTEMNTRVDILILGYFLTDMDVGIYSFAAILAEGVAQLPLAVRWNVDPLLARHFANREPDNIAAMSRRIKKVFYPVMIGIAALAIALFPLALRLFASDPIYRASLGVFAVLLVGITINSGYRPFYGILLQGGRPGIHTLFIAATVIGNFLLCFSLVPLMGIYGAATATACAFVLETFLLIALAKSIFGVRL